MQMGHDELADRLDRIESNQGEIVHQLTELNGTVRDVVTEMGGAPDALGRDPNRRSMRVRLHDLEQTQHAASAVGAALGLLFGRITRWLIVIGIVVGAVASLLRLAGVGG